MPFTDPLPAARRRGFKPRRAWPWGLVLALLGGCDNPQRPPAAPIAPPAPPPLAVAVPPMAPGPVPGAAPLPLPAPAAPPGAAHAPLRPAAPRHVRLGAPPAPRSWAELSQQAARRLVAAHPDSSYMGPPPEPLLAIPVLEVELNGDGSVRQVKVLRVPSQARDTTQLAIDAVHRAAPYGDVSRLSKPWKFVEVFLFDDARRFKPRSLDE